MLFQVRDTVDASAASVAWPLWGLRDKSMPSIAPPRSLASTSQLLPEEGEAVGGTLDTAELRNVLFFFLTKLNSATGHSPRCQPMGPIL